MYEVVGTDNEGYSSTFFKGSEDDCFEYIFWVSHIRSPFYHTHFILDEVKKTTHTRSREYLVLTAKDENTISCNPDEDYRKNNSCDYCGISPIFYNNVDKKIFSCLRCFLSNYYKCIDCGINSVYESRYYAKSFDEVMKENNIQNRFICDFCIKKYPFAIRVLNSISNKALWCICKYLICIKRSVKSIFSFEEIDGK